MPLELPLHVHPGARALVLEDEHALSDHVFLGDVHPYLHDAVLGTRRGLEGDALGVVETGSSPALLVPAR